jgi:hypothetical protein
LSFDNSERAALKQTMKNTHQCDEQSPIYIGKNKSHGLLKDFVKETKPLQNSLPMGIVTNPDHLLNKLQQNQMV